MARRRGMRWRLMGVGGSGGGGGSLAEALLAEAAVRFDFSQYSDINDMVDVNGGWGPLVDNTANIASSEFTADGLRLVAADPGGVPSNSQFYIEYDASPIIFGPDGVTVIAVEDVNAARVGSVRVSQFDLAGDGFNTYTPELQTVLTLSVDGVAADQWSIYHDDIAEDDVVDDGGDALVTALNFEGRCISIYVIDPDGQQAVTRIHLGDERFDAESPFLDPAPDYLTSPQPADTLYLGGGLMAYDYVYVEWCAWNRALTEAEVDALVAHFTA